MRTFLATKKQVKPVSGQFMIEQGLNCFRSPLPHSPLASVQTRSRLRIPVPHDVLHPDQELHLLRACAVSDKKIGGTVAKWSKAIAIVRENKRKRFIIDVHWLSGTKNQTWGDWVGSIKKYLQIAYITIDKAWQGTSCLQLSASLWLPLRLVEPRGKQWYLSYPKAEISPENKHNLS